MINFSVKLFLLLIVFCWNYTTAQNKQLFSPWSEANAQANIETYSTVTKPIYQYDQSLTLRDFLATIKSPEYPFQIILAKNNLLNFLVGVDLKAVIKSVLCTERGTTKVHKMLTLLQQIQSQIIPYNCPIQKDLQLLIFYLMQLEQSTILLTQQQQQPPPNFGKHIVAFTKPSPLSKPVIIHGTNNMNFKLPGPVLGAQCDVCAENKVILSLLQILLNRVNNIGLQMMKLMAVKPVTTPPPKPPFAYLIPFLPQPKDSVAKHHYQIICDYLKRFDLLQLLGLDTSALLGHTENDILKTIFTKSITLGSLIKDVRAAIKYYLEYEIARANLNLYTKAEIRKKFDLSAIFLDTLNFDALTLQQRAAFDTFFNFLLTLKNDIANFTTWTVAKTKAEFMKVLFEYFLEQTFVDQNVKDAIKQLMTCIKTTGEGLEPI